jgi:hypothetical protein
MANPDEANFHPCAGYATAAARVEFMESCGKSAGPNRQLTPSELTADPDTSKPLFYWQLFSILGYDRIESLIRTFYNRVFADNEDPEFKEAFVRVSGVEHHIETSTSYWCDAFGGGPHYHGSHYRLNFHHTHNAEKVRVFN